MTVHIKVIYIFSSSEKSYMPNESSTTIKNNVVELQIQLSGPQ